MIIKWTGDTTLTVHESETDEEGTLETLKMGTTSEIDIFDDDSKTGNVAIQFGDGSVAFGIHKEWYTVIKE